MKKVVKGGGQKKTDVGEYKIPCLLRCSMHLRVTFLFAMSISLMSLEGCGIYRGSPEGLPFCCFGFKATEFRAESWKMQG